MVKTQTVIGSRKFFAEAGKYLGIKVPGTFSKKAPLVQDSSFNFLSQREKKNPGKA